MPCLYHSHLPIKPLLGLPSPNLWPLYYCYIYMHLYMYINMHTCIYNLLSPFNVAHMRMCPGLRLGIWHPRSELIHGRNCSLMFSLRAFDHCCSSCRVGILGVFSVYIGMSAGVAIFLVLSRQLYCRNSWACFPCHAWGTLFIQHRHPGLWLLQSSHRLPWRSLSLQCRDCITEACICVGHSAVPYSLHCEQGWLFYNDLCCKKELPWWGVRTARICVCT